jgi:hypothetical protein
MKNLGIAPRACPVRHSAPVATWRAAAAEGVRWPRRGRGRDVARVVRDVGAPGASRHPLASQRLRLDPAHRALELTDRGALVEFITFR